MQRKRAPTRAIAKAPAKSKKKAEKKPPASTSVAPTDGRRRELVLAAYQLIAESGRFLTFCGGAAPIGLHSTGDPIFAAPGSLLGIPAISLPVLSAEELPLGLQLLGFEQADAALFPVAAFLRDLFDDTLARAGR